MLYCRSEQPPNLHHVWLLCVKCIIVSPGIILSCLVLSGTVQYRLIGTVVIVIVIVIGLVLTLVFCYKIIRLCCEYCGTSVHTALYDLVQRESS
jgi:small neutral amino acid transporter SnatA (MarC family)